MKKIKNIFSWIIPILIGLIAAFLIRSYLVAPVGVSGDSMLNNLHNGQRVWTLQQAPVRRGSVIVFDARQEDPGIRPGDRYYVKRVIGLPGDRVSAANGNLYVNGRRVNQNYITSLNRTSGTGNWDLSYLSSPRSSFVAGDSHWADGRASRVPKNNYFVLGDNRSVSEDSRYFGFVERKHLLGVAKVFPWTRNNSSVNHAWQHFFVK